MKKKSTYIIIGAVIIGFSLGFAIQPLVSGDNIYSQLRKLEYVLNTAFRNYVEEVDTKQLTEAAIKGMLNELDVHSIYLDAKQMETVNEEFDGNFEGIGVEFDIINDTITVISALPGGPSDNIGIRPSDKIIKIDGKSAVGLTFPEIPKMLKGRKGTKVNVTIKRSGSKELISYSVIRDIIPNNSINAFHLIDGTNIGFIKIDRFGNTTYNEFVSAISSLREQGMKKLILDLRNNPGGIFEQSVDIVREFLNKGDTIVYTMGRNPDDVIYSLAYKKGDYSDLPLIVLIDDGSASASEIVSGAIQDQDRGLVVGETSYGKGLVQRQYATGDGSAFRITIAKYYTPSGRCIQRPYKDKEKYRSLVGRIVPEEGNNIEHSIDKIINSFDKEKEKVEVSRDYVIVKKFNEKSKDFSDIDSLPIYKTKNGRIVLAGGGITPDFILKSDTINPLSRNLRNENIFVEFTDYYLTNEGKFIRDKYQSDFASFNRNFKINQELSGTFKSFAEKKGIVWNDAQYTADKSYIDTMIKMQFARTIWNRARALEIFYGIDRIVLKAIELFPAAEKIAKAK